MSVQVDVSNGDIDSYYEIATQVQKDEVRKTLRASGNAIEKKLAKNIKVRTRKAPHRGSKDEYSFYQRGKFKKFSDACVALAILKQKDHMTHLTVKEGVYEVWSRTTS